MFVQNLIDVWFVQCEHGQQVQQVDLAQEIELQVDEMNDDKEDDLEDDSGWPSATHLAKKVVLNIPKIF